MELTGKLVEMALAKAVDKIGEKLAKGKKLTDTETTIILLDGIYKLIQATNQRITEVKTDLTAKINETNRRVDEVREEVKLLRAEVIELKTEVAKLTAKDEPQHRAPGASGGLKAHV